jgi:hypothetical protein
MKPHRHQDLGCGLRFRQSGLMDITKEIEQLVARILPFARAGVTSWSNSLS